MRIVYFAHSVVSCWNNGNAHFQRGLLRALAALGHEAIVYEPARGWSRENLLANQGAAPLNAVAKILAGLICRNYDVGADDIATRLEQAIDGADLVIVHEWNDPAVVAAIGRIRRGSRFTLLFHDTHHRAVSDPEAIRHFDLDAYDGVLAFGATLASVYERWGWRGRAFVLHEAADTTLFKPPGTPGLRQNAVWVGNWGEGERAAELERYLLAPAQAAGAELEIYGVRYPAEAVGMLHRYGVRYHGWAANHAVPDLFARAVFTVHVPRRFYAQTLPGIPTIRVFEALACGIPLICAPWDDCEGLFETGADYLLAADGSTMTRHIRTLLHDPALAASLAESGLRRIQMHHTCEIRAGELLSIVASLRPAMRAA